MDSEPRSDFRTFFVVFLVLMSIALVFAMLGWIKVVAASEMFISFYFFSHLIVSLFLMSMIPLFLFFLLIPFIREGVGGWLLTSNIIVSILFLVAIYQNPNEYMPFFK